MKNLKRLLSTFLVLVTVVASILMPSAHSLLIDWNIKTNDVYFEEMISVKLKVNEDISISGVKKDVNIQNTGKSVCYVKAMVVITPIDENGLILTEPYTVGQNTVDTTKDISIMWTQNPAGGSWLPVSGASITERNYNENTWMFVWSNPVNPNASTGNLIDTLTIQSTSKRFKVEIISEGIYYKEINQWTDVYGLNINEGTGVITSINP